MKWRSRFEFRRNNNFDNNNSINNNSDKLGDNKMNKTKLNIILLELVREAINIPTLEFDPKTMVEATNNRIMELLKESQK